MNFSKLIDIGFALLDWSEHELKNYHIAFLMRRNKILSIGINKKCTHPLNLRNRKLNRAGKDISDAKLTCAELCCLLKSRNKNIDYNKCYMVNIRINRNNQLDVATPCMSCESLLRHYKVCDVYYTTKDGNFDFTKYQ
jgi:hypothetical protein